MLHRRYAIGARARAPAACGLRRHDERRRPCVRADADADADGIVACAAATEGAPRIFLMLPKLVISVVPDGDGSKVIEFGEWMGTTRTLKGEIGLPVTQPLAADAPFRRVLNKNGDGTLCANCHRGEDRHATIANGFVSIAFQPGRGTFVTLTELEELHTLCTQADAPGARCAMIHALFDFGEITEGAFSPVVETFFPE